MLTGIDITFDLLAKTRNEAAITVLLPALDSEDPAIRLRAVRAILNRGTIEGAKKVLRALPSLGEAGFEIAGGFRDLLQQAALELLDEQADLMEMLPVLERFQLTGTAVKIFELMQSMQNATETRAAGQTILSLANVLGHQARDSNKVVANREVLAKTLAELIQNNSQNISLTLVDAFLSVCRWDDPWLTTLLTPKTASYNLIIDRLHRSRAEGVLQLLAGWIRRARIPTNVEEILKTRGDEAFLHAVLDAIGDPPSPQVLRNIGTMAPMLCLRANNIQIKPMANQRRSALVRAVAVNEGDNLRALKFILDVLRECSTPEIESAIVRAIGDLKHFDADTVIRSALAASRDEEATIDQNVQAIVLLMDLATGEGALADASREALKALHTDEFLDRIDYLSDATNRRLGSLVRVIDKDYVHRLELLLRHPVCRFRVRGVKAAIAMDAIDQLADAWRRLFQGPAGEHHDARIAAVDALSRGYGDETLAILREVASGQAGAIQEAAAEALLERETIRHG